MPRYWTVLTLPFPTCFMPGGMENINAVLFGYSQVPGLNLVISMSGSSGKYFRAGLDKGNTGSVDFQSVWQEGIEVTFNSSVIAEAGDRIVVEATRSPSSSVASRSWIIPEGVVHGADLAQIGSGTLGLTIGGVFDASSRQKNYLIEYLAADQSPLGGSFAQLDNRAGPFSISLDVSALPSAPEWIRLYAYDEIGGQPLPGTLYHLNPSSNPLEGIGYWAIETEHEVQ